jgi:hypothetical protein
MHQNPEHTPQESSTLNYVRPEIREAEPPERLLTRRKVLGAAVGASLAMHAMGLVAGSMATSFSASAPTRPGY